MAENKPQATQEVTQAATPRAAEPFKGMVTRDKKVAFLGCYGEQGVSAGTETFNRMTKFTEMNNSKNAKEYTRKYVDEEDDVTDVTGYAPSTSYAFDLYAGNKVHEELINIHDNELRGDEAIRNIIVVDFTKPVDSQEGQYHATKRQYSVIPGGDGSDANTYTYTGTFKTKSALTHIKVQSSDNFQTVTEVE